MVLEKGISQNNNSCLDGAYHRIYFSKMGCYSPTQQFQNVEFSKSWTRGEHLRLSCAKWNPTKLPSPPRGQDDVVPLTTSLKICKTTSMCFVFFQPFHHQTSSEILMNLFLRLLWRTAVFLFRVMRSSSCFPVWPGCRLWMWATGWSYIHSVWLT